MKNIEKQQNIHKYRVADNSSIGASFMGFFIASGFLHQKYYSLHTRLGSVLCIFINDKTEQFFAGFIAINHTDE